MHRGRRRERASFNYTTVHRTQSILESVASRDSAGEPGLGFCVSSIISTHVTTKYDFSRIDRSKRGAPHLHRHRGGCRRKRKLAPTAPAAPPRPSSCYFYPFCSGGNLLGASLSLCSSVRAGRSSHRVSHQGSAALRVDCKIGYWMRRNLSLEQSRARAPDSGGFLEIREMYSC